MKKMLLALALAGPLSTTALVIGTATVKSSIDARLIAKVVHLSVPAIRSCYHKQLLVEPTLRGELTVHFTITNKGVVGLAMIDGPGLSPVVDSCITALFVKLRFPEIKEASDKVEVYFPFSFEPPQEQP